MLNTGKFLLIGALAIAAASGAGASSCEYSGFYVGANMGMQLYDFHDDTRHKRTKPLAELLVGYDRKLENFKLGVELLAGTVIGTMKYKEPHRYGDNFCTYKTPWSISLMPRVGYMCAPKFEVYGTFGARIANIRFFLREEDVDYTLNKKYKRSRNRIQPLVGVGMRYEIANYAFVKLEYNYAFSTPLRFRLSKAEHDWWEVHSLQAHTAKLGFGVRF